MTIPGSLLDSVRGLSWPARRVAPAGPPGVHRSRVRGADPEFSEYRAFRQGDDPRRLDWKLLARTDRVFLRLADDRAVVGTVLAVDSSASMDFGGKRETAAQLAVALAQVAHQSGDPVGLLTGGRVVPARTRRGIVSEIAQAVGAPGASGNLAALLSRSALPSRLVILSDFLDDDPVLLRAVTMHQGQGGDVLAIDVIAREELEPQTSPFAAVDPERPDESRPFAPVSRGEYQRRFAAWRDETARNWRRVGAQWSEVVTDEPVPNAVRRIVSGDTHR